jgi:RNA polymerase sigma factor (sigma-70 family)
MHMPESEPANETALIRRAQVLRDRTAFGTLVQRHQSRVRGFLLRLCRDHDLADDLGQEVFIQAYKHLNSYQPTGAFLSWLLKIAYNCFLQEHRKTTRKTELLVNYERYQEVQARRYQGISAEELALEAALQKLSPDEAACISLCYSFGCSHSEAVAILGMPLGTIKSHVKRGKEKLRQLLEISVREIPDTETGT